MEDTSEPPPQTYTSREGHFRERTSLMAAAATDKRTDRETDKQMDSTVA